MPAPKGNKNAMKNASRLNRLKLGLLPSVMSRQMMTARVYRRDLESAVLDIKGRVDTLDAHLIDQAAGAMIHSSVCYWLLREKLTEMDSSDILRCSESLMKSREVRNRAVERLNLVEAESKLIDRLYGDEELPPDVQQAVSQAHTERPSEKMSQDTSPAPKPRKDEK